MSQTGFVPQVGSGGTTNITNNYAIVSGTNIILADATAGDVTVTYPSAASNVNSTETVIKSDATANKVYIAGTDVINGVIILDKQHQWVSHASDGTNWNQTSEQVPDINVKTFGAKGDGVNDDKAVISTAAGIATGGMLIFPAGTYKISTNLAIAVGVKFHNGAKLSIDNGVVVTLSNTIEAGRWQIFSGLGTVSLTGNQPEVLPEWWGMLPDDAVDDTTIFQAIITALPNGGTVRFGIGAYEVSDIIILANNISLIGTPHLSKIHYEATSDTWVGTNGTSSDNNHIEGMTFYSDFDGTVYHGVDPPHIYGIRGYFTNLTIKNCEFYGLNKDCINGHVFGGVSHGIEANVLIDGNYLHDSAREGIQYRNVSGIRITNNRIENIAGVAINTENDAADNISWNHVYSHNIINGCAQGIKVSGINLGRFENIIVSDNVVYDTSYGINYVGYDGVVAHNVSHDNLIQGIRIAGKNVIVEGNVSYNNDEHGLWMSGATMNNGVVINNVCYDNRDAPVQIATYVGATITGELKRIGNRFYTYNKDSDNVEDTDNVFTSSSIWYARKITATRSEKVTQVRLRMKQLGSGAGTVTATMYSDTPGLPDAAHGSVSDTVTIADISTDGSTLTSFYFPTPPRLVDDALYWIVIKPSGYTYSAGVNELIIMTDADGGTDEVAKYDAGWALTSATDGADYVLEYLEDDFSSKTNFSFNTPEIVLDTPYSDYRSIVWKLGQTSMGRILYYKAVAGDEAYDQLRFSAGGQLDVFKIGQSGDLTIANKSEEDTDGGREARITAVGEQSGGESSTLGYYEISHDGVADDEKGKFILKLNDGNDGSAPHVDALTILSSGNTGIGVVAPTAVLNLKAGTATAGTAPLKLTSGTVLGTPEAGAIEFNTDSLYYTQTTGPTRKTIATIETAEIDNGNSGVADTIAWASGNYQKSTLTDNCVFTFTAPAGIGILRLKIIQDGVGGRTVTWPGTCLFPGSVEPVLSSGIGDIDLVYFDYDGTNYIFNNAVFDVLP